MIALLVVLAGPAVLGAAATVPQTQTVVAGEEYGAGPVWTIFFGKDYRDLWTRPITVPVLDVESFAGGLTPTKPGGRRQTRSLGFKGENGREYKFRSIDKDPSDALPKELRGEALEYLARDQTSSGHPAAPLIAEPLLHAAGLLHVHSRIVVLPDSPRLGEFRKEFAGMLGTIEDDPEDDKPEQTPGFEKIARIVETEELYEILRGSAGERVDTRAYLRARLMDVYVGDWDRHYQQWEWGKSEVDGLWKPIPKDRDQAFSRYDGLLVGLVSTGGQKLGVFGPRYEGVLAFNWAAREMDRRFLAGLAEDVWKAEARDLAARLTDDVIAAAVDRLPPEYRSSNASRLTEALRARRDSLSAMADEWYRLLARAIDVFATDDDEKLHVARTSDGLYVRLEGKTPASTPAFDRRFTSDETREVRVYLQGGDDQAVVKGTGPVTLRVIGGAGADVLDDSQGGHTRFYDYEGENGVRPGPGTKHEARPYTEPESPKEERPRDWGARLSTPIWLSAGSEIGVFVGAGMTRDTFGFRRQPYASRQSVRVGYAMAASRARAEYFGDFRRPQSRANVEVLARVSGIEILRFYGFGNETSDDEGDEFFKALQSQFTLAPALMLPSVGGARLRIGPKLRYSWGDLRQEERFLSRTRPYGSGNFGEAGLAASLDWDSRDIVAAPRKGVSARIGGSLFPAVWDVERTFGEVHGHVLGAYTVDAGLESTLAARVGAKRVFGDYPYHEAAFIGGSRRDATVRGLRGQRYAGDASLYANADLRVRLFSVAVLVPTEVGVFGLADVGRAFLDGETSRRWHTGVGGGLWIAPVRRENTLTLSAAKSEGRTSIYLTAGFLF